MNLVQLIANPFARLFGFSQAHLKLKTTHFKGARLQFSNMPILPTLTEDALKMHT